MIDFRYVYFETKEEIFKKIKEMEGRVVQQVVYSSYHDGLTQIDFTNKVIRSNIKLDLVDAISEQGDKK